MRISDNNMSLRAGIKLSDIINPEDLKSLLEDFYELTGIGMAITDLDGDILIKAGWQDLCTNYPLTCPSIQNHHNICRHENDTGDYVTDQNISIVIKFNKYIGRLRDISIPIKVGESCAGYILIGQFFFKDEDIDYEAFRQFAGKCGYNEMDYLKSIGEIPHYTREEIDSAVKFYSKLAGLISEMGYKNINLQKILSERDNLLDSLKKSESKMRKYIENAPEGIFITDKNGIFLEVNRAACDITGYSENELLGKHIIMFVPRSEHPLFREHIQKINEFGKTYLEIPFIHKNGTIRIWSVDSIIISKDCYAGFTKDITERKLIEKRVERLADDYEKVFNGLQEAMFLVKVNKEREFRFIRSNLAFQKKTGINITDITGKNPIELLGEKNGAEILRSFKKCTEIRDVYKFEEELDSPEGKHIWFTTINPVIEDGRIRYLIGSSIDITATKNVEESLKKQLQFERLIAEISSSFIHSTPDNLHLIINDMLRMTCSYFHVDRGYIYEFYNDGKSMKKIHEWASDTAPSDLLEEKRLSDFPWWSDQIKNNNFIYIEDTFLLPEEAEAERSVFLEQGIKSLLNILIKKERSVIGFLGFDSVYRHKKWTDDQISLMSVIANTVFDALSKYYMELELIRSREIAVAANNAKSDFIANVSHEIRTPLNGIIGFTDLLMSTDLSENQKQYLENVNVSAKSLLGILNDILDFSKIEAGKLLLNEEETDLISLIESAVDITKYSADKKGLEMLLDIRPDTPRYVVLDGLRVKQILINLLSNAIKFTEKGEVELKVYPEFTEFEEDTVRLFFSVRDTGIGISEKDRAVIFRDFSQADVSTTKKYGGTGLGLTISTRLLDKMCAVLELKSRVNEGSTFSFSIKRPFRKTEKFQAEVSSAIRKILIIDDNESNINILKTMLDYLGISHESFTSSSSALERIKDRDDFDLIIADFSLDIIDDLEKLKNIRKDNGIGYPLIIMHSFRDAQENINLLKAKDLRYRLQKPVKFSELVKILNQAVSSEAKYTQPEIISRKTRKEWGQGPDLVTILIAEDNSINLMLIQSIIQSILPNAVIVEAKDGTEAVRFYRECGPDLIFMDIQMPEKDGYTASKEIRKSPEHPMHGYVPIIALTARAEQTEKERCLKSGMDDYIQKPITRDSVMPILEKYLNLNVQEEIDCHFDKTGLLKSLYGDQILYKRMVDESRAVMPKYTADLKKALLEKDIKSVRENAHKIKGASFTMHFNTLSELAKRIESDNTLSFSQIGDLIKEIEKEINIIIDVL